MAKNKEANETRLKYERAVSLACDACRQEIEEARKEFGKAKNGSHAARDKAIDIAKQNYDKEIKKED